MRWRLWRRRCIAVAVQEAVRPSAAAQVRAAGEALAADGHGVRAAGMEAAATGRRDQARNLAEGGYCFCGLLGAPQALRGGGRGEEQARIWVLGVLRGSLTPP